MEQPNMEQPNMEQPYFEHLNDVFSNICTLDGITIEILHSLLWSDLNSLRNDPNKDKLISEWNFKDDFINTENSHADGKQPFDKVTWEQSYVYLFFMSHYH